MSILNDFKNFITRGNVIELAVAFVMGSAFYAVVTALVTDLVTPLIGLPGHLNFDVYSITVNGSTFLFGAFVNSVIGFIAIAVAVFFFIVKPMEKAKTVRKKGPQPAPTTKDCPYCLSKIPIKATRCAYCTSQLQ
jgi:large conductance mechanosensitive channel